jgi:hypothetical protein
VTPPIPIRSGGCGVFRPERGGRGGSKKGGCKGRKAGRLAAAAELSAVQQRSPCPHTTTRRIKAGQRHSQTTEKIRITQNLRGGSQGAISMHSSRVGCDTEPQQRRTSEGVRGSVISAAICMSACTVLDEWP